MAVLYEVKTTSYEDSFDQKLVLLPPLLTPKVGQFCMLINTSLPKLS